VTTGTQDALKVILSPLKFAWGAGNADTLTFTVTADEAGTYNTYTQDGSSGTITYSLNGAAYASVTGTIVLAIGDTIRLRRTTPTAQGFSRWAL
jgi:beta-glucanase (GH16 family)